MNEATVATCVCLCLFPSLRSEVSRNLLPVSSSQQYQEKAQRPICRFLAVARNQKDEHTTPRLGAGPHVGTFAAVELRVGAVPVLGSSPGRGFAGPASGHRLAVALISQTAGFV